MRKPVKVPAAWLEAEMRNIARKMAHRPWHEVIQIIHERTGIAIEPAYLEALLKQARARENGTL
jgi:hypothetical protein